MSISAVQPILKYFESSIQNFVTVRFRQNDMSVPFLLRLGRGISYLYNDTKSKGKHFPLDFPMYWCKKPIYTKRQEECHHI
jgi:hypothetical protein